MANKYIRHGATFNGDGTSSALATSNGGVGAWNTITYFTGTTPAYGVLAAGDRIYIRSKSEADSDISLINSTLTYPGSSVATVSNMVTWIIDAGTIWPGISGVVTIGTSNTTGVTCRPYNNFIAKSYNLVFKNTASTATNAVFFNCSNCFTVDIKVDTSANVYSTGFNHVIQGGLHINFWLLQGTVTYNVLTWTREYDTTFISPRIEILGPLYFLPSATTVFSSGDAVSSRYAIYGGELVSNISIAGIVLVGATGFSANIDLFGFKYPSTTPLSNSTFLTKDVSITSTGNDGALGSTYIDKYFTYSSRADEYYPTLNALLGLSTPVPWSYSIYPYRTDGTHPAKVSVSKLWTQADAVKTITVQFLWPTSMTTPNKSTVWMTISYTDSDGNRVTQSSFDIEASAVDTSTALWSDSTYGATLFNKLKLSLVSSAAIKQDTEVIVTFFSLPIAASAKDIIILCPDVEFS